jgi:hypothetical protein
VIIVVLYGRCQLADPVALFRFVHPHPDIRNVDNSRYCHIFAQAWSDYYLLSLVPFLFVVRYGTVTFAANADAVLHGFSGTFESLLYGDVYLSTVPRTHTPDMYSWFPLFIPLDRPVTIKKGDTITISVWR